MRVQQILDAALVEFAERGFTAARMDDIAARCGLSKGGLYAHFQSKDGIFEALLARSLVPPQWTEPPPPPLSEAPRAFAQRVGRARHAAPAPPAARPPRRLRVRRCTHSPQCAQPPLIRQWRP